MTWKHESIWAGPAGQRPLLSPRYVLTARPEAMRSNTILQKAGTNLTSSAALCLIRRRTLAFQLRQL